MTTKPKKRKYKKKKDEPKIKYPWYIRVVGDNDVMATRIMEVVRLAQRYTILADLYESLPFGNKKVEEVHQLFSIADEELRGACRGIMPKDQNQKKAIIKGEKNYG